jgi:hypothetical protein
VNLLLLLWIVLPLLIVIGAWLDVRRARRARAAQAEAAKEIAALEAAEPGGTVENAIAVESPAVVESRASMLPCAICRGPVRVMEHAAETIEGRRVRVVRVLCPQCGISRTAYFRLIVPQ